MDDTKRSPWHIPRASLSSNSSSGTGKERSNDHKYHRDSVVIDLEEVHLGKQRYQQPGNEARKFSSSSSSSELSYHSERKQKSKHRNSKTEQEEIYSPKRFSRSSQGSTDSGNSTHSASSLLLTVKNLENFAKIHETQQKSMMLPQSHPATIDTSEFISAHRKYPNNLMIENKHLKLSKTKEFDELSEASSMHFTVVNDMSGAKDSCGSQSICKRSHQVTILIITMTVFFCIGILFTVLMMELRAREMPR